MTLDRFSSTPFRQPPDIWDRSDTLEPDGTPLAEKLQQWKSSLQMTDVVCNHVFVACPGPTFERHLPELLKNLELSEDSLLINFDAHNLPPGANADLKQILLDKKEDLLRTELRHIVIVVDNFSKLIADKIKDGVDKNHLKARLCHDWCQNTVERPISNPDDPFFMLMDKLKEQGKQLLVINHISPNLGNEVYDVAISSAILGDFGLGKFSAAVLGIPA